MKYIFNQVIFPCFLVYLAFVALLFLLQNTFVYVPPKFSIIDMKPLEPFKKIQANTSDGLSIKGYYLQPEKNKPIIIEFHGNGSHPSWEIPKFKKLIDQGYGFLLASYRGYDGNPGKPSEKGLSNDGDAFLNWIKANPDLKSNPLIIYGASIGSGIAIETAVRHPEISALILEAPYDRLPAVAAWHYPYIPFIQYMMKNKFYNDEKIKKIKAPALFLLAGQDNIVPMQFGKRLADLANEPKEAYVFEDAGHLNLYNYGAAEVVLKFIESSNVQ